MTHQFQIRSWFLIAALLVALPVLAQVEIGDNVNIHFSGDVSVGYDLSLIHI